MAANNTRMSGGSRKVMVWAGYQNKGMVFLNTKLLQKREMRKDIVIELSYKGFSRASDYS